MARSDAATSPARLAATRRFPAGRQENIPSIARPNVTPIMGQIAHVKRAGANGQAITSARYSASVHAATGARCTSRHQPAANRSVATIVTDQRTGAGMRFTPNVSQPRETTCDRLTWIRPTTNGIPPAFTPSANQPAYEPYLPASTAGTS